MTIHIEAALIRARGEQGFKGGARRGLARAVAVALVALAVGPADAVMAEGPKLTITSPANGSAINNQLPFFSRTTNDPFDVETEMFDPVRLNIYAGTVVGEGEPLQALVTPSLATDGTWSLVATQALPDGVYTAQATQATGESEPVTFTVDTTPPGITLTWPANGSSSSSGSQLVAGAAGTSEGDLPTITIRLFSGSSTESSAGLESLAVQAANGGWSVILGGLSPGTYTVRAEQSDRAGNVGTSAPATFTVRAPASPPPPVASFTWFPAAPTTGQSISLVSNSSDATSPITAFAWDRAGGGAFRPGGQVFTTSYSTPGRHIVQLRVTAADGLSSVVSETIPVTRPPLVLMQPFPIVRIAGSETSSGVDLALLTAQAPTGGSGHGDLSRASLPDTVREQGRRIEPEPEQGRNAHTRVPAVRAFPAGRCDSGDQNLEAGGDRQVHALYDSPRQAPCACRHVSRSDGPRADCVPVGMNFVRIEKPVIHVDRERVRVDARGPIAIAASLCVVFACFFAIGRVTREGSASQAEASSNTSDISPGASIPVRLSSAAPLDNGVPASRPVPVRQASQPVSTQASSATVPAFTPQLSPARVPPSPAPPSQPPPSIPSAPAPPQASPAVESPAPKGGSSGSGSGRSTPSSGGGGSFESSG